MLTAQPEVANYLLQTYATNGVIAETDTDLMQVAKPSTVSPTQYAGALVMKSLRCGEVCDE